VAKINIDPCRGAVIFTINANNYTFSLGLYIDFTNVCFIPSFKFCNHFRFKLYQVLNKSFKFQFSLTIILFKIFTF